MIKNAFLALVAASSVLFVVTPALAATPVVTGGYDTIVISHRGVSFTENSDSAQNRYRAISGINEKVKDLVRGGFDELIRSQIGWRTDFDGLDVWVTGNSEIAINSAGAQPGLAKFSLTGLDVSFKARFKGFRWGTWRCESNVTIRSARFTDGDLNINTGSIANLKLNSTQPEVRQDCSHVLGFIPVLGDFAEGKINDRFADFAQSVSSKFANPTGISFGAVNFMGLDQVVPVGRTVNGLDVGTWLRGSMHTILAQGVSISLVDERTQFYSEGSYSWTPIVFRAPSSDVRIELHKERTVEMKCLNPNVFCDL